MVIPNSYNDVRPSGIGNNDLCQGGLRAALQHQSEGADLLDKSLGRRGVHWATKGQYNCSNQALTDLG
jgi:hypothetical protein